MKVLKGNPSWMDKLFPAGEQAIQTQRAGQLGAQQALVLHLGSPFCK